MVNTMSWLYGASQGQECPRCHLRIPLPSFGDPDPLAGHVRWWCDDRPKPRDARGRFVKLVLT